MIQFQSMLEETTGFEVAQNEEKVKEKGSNNHLNRE